ncbi:Peptidase S33 tripeptidyl aminopeptidase-like C-terminal protein [Rutstroemia sp. NJR-2017a BVV2]|nr:Peptidase S33 tripeptidyl aminopeptidase-like C-terminal protein [Rutstroemia sp. NJR-2017a BVV2]
MSITPSPDLSYYPCYESFECARLELPLDWNNQSTDPRRVAVALIRLPSKVPTSDPRYGGSIIINPGMVIVLPIEARAIIRMFRSKRYKSFPGGPGGSGINFARYYGRYLQTIADSPLTPNDTRSNDISNKYFDILSFDPRGVGFTTPAFICFPDATQRMNWKIASDAEGLLGSSSAAFELMWARKHALGDACYARMAVDESERSALGAYMNTPIVAMDMKGIVEALSRSGIDSPSRCAKYQSSTVESFDKIQYWGFSYGTLLGETFAAMYPDLVGRMVLDGVVDADRHYAGTWDGNLENADAIMKKFSDYCFEAGLERCALYSDKGPQGIQDHLDNIIASIADAPISVPVSDVRGPAVITHSDVKGAVRDALYSPFESFEKLGRIMHDISQGNGTLLADSKTNEYLSQDLTPECRLHGPYSRYCFSPPADYAEEVVGAIACSDGPDQTNMTAADFLEYWRRVRRESIYLGDRWARNRLMCVFWRLRPRVTYPDTVEGLTSKPILFVSNTLDPVTSLSKSSGQKMSRRFNGSRLLQQDSVGHLSLSTPSICSARIVRRYFQTGALPEVGKICSVYERPFSLPGNEPSVTLEPEDHTLLEALRAIANHMW